MLCLTKSFWASLRDQVPVLAMAYQKHYAKLLFVAILGLLLLLLSGRFLQWHGQISTSTLSRLPPLKDHVFDTDSPTPTDLSKSNPDNMLQRRLPTALVIGFAKCGTHALRTFLTLHPSIAAEDYELSFFTRNYNKGFEWYRKHMPPSLPNQITIEKTPSYIESSSAIGRMYDFDPNLKLIILVRDPVVRVQSLYARVLHHYPDLNRTFEEWIVDRTYDYFARYGNYAPFIRDVFNVFNKDQVLILDGEYLSRNPTKVLQMCEQFLNITPIFREEFFIFNKEKGFYCINSSLPYYRQLVNRKDAKPKVTETGCFSESKGREHPVMSKKLEKRFVNLFRASNEDLFHVIGKRFPWTGGQDNIQDDHFSD